jgi:NAD-dependent dihydropyrimidine dehydrogenase PreA subunit
MVNLYATNTLRYDRELCNNCGMCSTVCPHGVFAAGEDAARLVNAGACMECGACQKNCPTGAVTVDSGVGCAAAMIMAALTGRKEACCGPRDPCGDERTEAQAAACCGAGYAHVPESVSGPKAEQPQAAACCGSAPESGTRRGAEPDKPQTPPCCG